MRNKLGWLVLCLLAASCDSAEGPKGPYDCLNDSIPDDAQCFEFQGVDEAFRFVGTDAIGTWSSNEFETCIEYRGDGSATMSYWGIIGGVPREDTIVRWGIWIDEDGDPILRDGDPIIIHRDESGTVLDRRLLGVNFTAESGFRGDIEKVDACPENRESNQGMLTFFSTNSNTDPITVALDSFPVGELSSFFTGDDPECGGETTTGVLTIYRQPGTYRFQALSSVATWGPTNLVVEKGECRSNALR